MSGLSQLERRVFVDTSAFFALADNSDGRHSAARTIAARIDREGLSWITTDLVVAETHALLLSRVGRHLAQIWIDSLRVPIVFLDRATYDAAHALLRQYADKRFTLADAVSFVVMDMFGLRLAFTFDEHFRQYGLEVLAP